MDIHKWCIYPFKQYTYFIFLGCGIMSFLYIIFQRMILRYADSFRRAYECKIFKLLNILIFSTFNYFGREFPIKNHLLPTPSLSFINQQYILCTCTLNHWNMVYNELTVLVNCCGWGDIQNFCDIKNVDSLHRFF